MLFVYKATTADNQRQDGSIDAPNVDLAIASLQRRGFIILDIKEANQQSFFSRKFSFRKKAKLEDVVIMSRQISTLFEAKVSALQAFRLLAGETESPILQKALTGVADDINSGVSISESLVKHPEVFSDFYVNMVKAGEESGKLSEAFSYLASYLERTHALLSKAFNALIYPVFVIVSFIVVMILMLVYVIPKISAILDEVGQDLPIYTRIIIGLSDFFVNYGVFILIALIIVGFFVGRHLRTPAGKLNLSALKLSVPYIGKLYQKLYLSRMADNLSTMMISGISMVRALEITADVVGNEVYKNIMLQAAEAVKGGSAVSEVFYKHPEVPAIMVQMMKVGEETGKLGFVLETLSRFYQREVNNAIETLVGLIEPAMIVVLGLGVGILLTAVLVPIYNLAQGI
jgi:type IV pilus assembly protein PilC